MTLTQENIQQAIVDQALPTSFIDTVNRWYRPIADDIANTQRHLGNTAFIGIQGCQGSGKSTLSEFLKILLASDHGLTCAVLSLDDFYLTKEERMSLADAVHPLLATRGVPGTHDVSLALTTIDALKKLGTGAHTTIPRFDKALDNRANASQWDRVEGPTHVILLEGWCVGLNAQEEQALLDPVNALEEEKDSNVVWRRYVNEKLATDYQPLFAGFDRFIVLKAPSFSSVYNWRRLQETKLIAKRESAKTHGKPDQTMTDEGLKQFIAHYQRLTEHALRTLPAQADWLLTLEENHRISDLTKPKGRGV